MDPVLRTSRWRQSSAAILLVGTCVSLGSLVAAAGQNLDKKTSLKALPEQGQAFCDCDGCGSGWGVRSGLAPGPQAQPDRGRGPPHRGRGIGAGLAALVTVPVIQGLRRERSRKTKTPRIGCAGWMSWITSRTGRWTR